MDDDLKFLILQLRYESIMQVFFVWLYGFKYNFPYKFHIRFLPNVGSRN